MADTPFEYTPNLHIGKFHDKKFPGEAELNSMRDKIDDLYCVRDTETNMPSPDPDRTQRWYFAVDTKKLYLDNGTEWLLINQFNHGNRHINGEDDIPSATSVIKGLMNAEDKDKLDQIDENADVTAENQPQSHNTSHEDGGVDEIDVTDLSGLLADKQHPLDHAETHQLGGSDVLNVTGLQGLLAEPQNPNSHKNAHQQGGTDELNVTGLSGLLAEEQNPVSHRLNHMTGGSDEINVDDLHGVLYNRQKPKVHGNLHTHDLASPGPDEIYDPIPWATDTNDGLMNKWDHQRLPSQEQKDSMNNATNPSALNPFITSEDLAGLPPNMVGSWSAPVQTIQELRDIPIEDRTDKQCRLVEDAGCLYRFDMEGTGTDDGDKVITPTDLTGRWFKASSLAESHLELNNVQGGNPTEQYHFTLSEYTELLAHLIDLLNPHEVSLEQARSINNQISGNINANNNILKNLGPPVDDNDSVRQIDLINAISTFNHSAINDDEPQKHRLINDSVPSALALYSGQKIQNEIENLQSQMPGNFYIQYAPSELPDNVRIRFTLPAVWEAGKILVYVDGLEQKNGTDVDITSYRGNRQIEFDEPPPTDALIWARYKIAILN